MSIQAAWQETRNRFAPFFSEGVLPAQLLSRQGDDSLHVSHGQSADANVNDIELSFRLKTDQTSKTVRQASLMLLEVHNRARQQSMGLLCYALVLELTRRAACPQLHMRCGSSLGGYVWPSCGAQPDFDAYPELRNDVCDAILRRLTPLKPMMPTHRYNHFYDLAHMRNRTDLTEIALSKVNIFDICADDEFCDAVPGDLMYRLNTHPGFYEHNIPIGFYLTAGLNFRAVHYVDAPQELLRQRLKVKRPDVLAVFTP